VKRIAHFWPYILIAISVTGFLYQYLLASP
jgi:hypothetical protein